jgi:hypothetical protein
VAVIRLAAPYTTECPPVRLGLWTSWEYIDLFSKFIDFPEDLKGIMNGHTAVIHGGLQMHVAVRCYHNEHNECSYLRSETEEL